MIGTSNQPSCGAGDPGRILLAWGFICENKRSIHNPGGSKGSETLSSKVQGTSVIRKPTLILEE